MSIQHEHTRLLARIAQLYWSPDYMYEEKSWQDAKQSWQAALLLFLRQFAFERQGAPTERYKRLACNAVGSVCKGKRPCIALASNCWLRISADAGELKLNPRNHPLSVAGEGLPKLSGTSLIELLSSLRSHDHNLLLWAKSELENGDASRAVSVLTTVRGIGPKISRFFLRDVCHNFGINEGDAGRAELQPVDLWIWRAGNIWLDRTEVKFKGDDKKIREEFALRAERANVSAADLNVAVWYLGARITQNEGQFEKLLTDLPALKRWMRMAAKAFSEEQRV